MQSSLICKSKRKLESEKKLLKAIKNGNRDAMHSLYDRYVGYAMAVSLRYVPLRDDAEDIVQDSFVKVFSAIDRFEYRGEGSLKGWILRIVVNAAISFLKQKERFSCVEEFPDEADVGEPDVELVPPDVLTKLIGELPEGYRVVLNLYVFAQMSHKEIANRLGIKEASSASQYLRAKKLLARKIKDYLKAQDYE